MNLTDTKPEMPTKFLSDAVLVAVASAYVYYLSFIYEKAYLSFFGVPSQFITMDFTTILSFAVIIFGLFLFTFPVLNLFVIILSRTKNLKLANLLRPYWIFLFIFIVHIYIFGFSQLSLLISYFIVCCIFAFFDFVFPLLTQKKKKTYWEKISAQEEADSGTQTIPKILNAKYGRESSILVALFIFGYLISSNAGLGEAARQKDYLFTNSQPPLIVLRVYSSRMICAQYDVKKNEVIEQFTIINLDNANQELSLKSIGPIQKVIKANVLIPSPSIISTP